MWHEYLPVLAVLKYVVELHNPLPTTLIPRTFTLYLVFCSRLSRTRDVSFAVTLKDCAAFGLLSLANLISYTATGPSSALATGSRCHLNTADVPRIVSTVIFLTAAGTPKPRNQRFAWFNTYLPILTLRRARGRWMPALPPSNLNFSSDFFQKHFSACCLSISPCIPWTYFGNVGENRLLLRRDMTKEIKGLRMNLRS